MKFIEHICMRKNSEECTGRNTDLYFSTLKENDVKICTLTIQRKKVDLRDIPDYTFGRKYDTELQVCKNYIFSKSKLK